MARHRAVVGRIVRAVAQRRPFWAGLASSTTAAAVLLGAMALGGDTAAAQPSPPNNEVDCEAAFGDWETVERTGPGGTYEVHVCNDFDPDEIPIPRPNNEVDCEAAFGDWETVEQTGPGGTREVYICKNYDPYPDSDSDSDSDPDSNPDSDSDSTPTPDNREDCEAADNMEWKYTGSPPGSPYNCVSTTNEDGSVTAECKFRPPFGSSGAQAADDWGPGDIPNLGAGALAEVFRALGFHDQRIETEIPARVVQNHPWYVEQLEDEGECHLQDRLPHDGCWWEDGNMYQPGDAGRDEFLPDMCWGQYPSQNYDIYYDSGGITDLSNKLWGWPTSLLFKMGQGAIRVAFWLTGEAHTFDIVGMFGDAVNDSIDSIDAEIVDGLTLTRIAWLVLVGYMAIAAARGKIALAGGQLVITVVLLALATVLLASPVGYMQGSSDLMTGLSNQVLSAAASEDVSERCEERMTDGWEGRYPGMTERLDASNCSNIVRMDLQRRLHELFVEIPYDHINWNGPDKIGECDGGSERRDNILSVGPHGTHAWPRDYMRNGEDSGDCAHLAAFNKNPTGDRLLIALVTGVAAFFLALILGLSALTILLAKFITAMLFAVAPLAAVAAIMPGAGRKLAWTWVTTAVQAIVVAVGMSALLAVGMLLVVPALETAMEAGRSPMTAYLIVLGPLIAMWLGRKKMLSSLKNVSEGFAGRLSRLAPGAGAAGFGAGASFAGGGGGGGGQSLFGAPRAENLAQGLTMASTGTTAAIGAGSLAARGVGGFARLNTVPFRAGGRFVGMRLRERRAPNRIMANNVRLDVLNKALGSSGGGGGRGSGGRSVVDQVARATLKPRHQRQRDRAIASHQAVDAFRARTDRRWWSPVAETAIRTGTKARMAFGDHSLATRRGRQTRSNRAIHPDPVVETGAGRAGRAEYQALKQSLLARSERPVARPNLNPNPPNAPNPPPTRPPIVVPPATPGPRERFNPQTGNWERPSGQ